MADSEKHNKKLHKKVNKAESLIPDEHNQQNSSQTKLQEMGKILELLHQALPKTKHSILLRIAVLKKE